jgi:hypothetical protein
MAHITGIDRLPHQLLHKIGYMRVMARETFPLRIESTVLHFHFRDPFFFVPVALETQVARTFHREVVLIISGMGIMAVDAFFLHRFVGEFLRRECLRLVRVALKAHVVSRSVQELRKIGLMGIVAHDASSDRHRSVDEFPRDDFFVMAHDAEIRPVRAKLVLKGRLVRVVAARAISLFNGTVYGAFCIHLVVTFIANILDALYLGELVLPFALVTEGAIAHGHRAMYVFVLAHAAMAFIRHAGVSGQRAGGEARS